MELFNIKSDIHTFSSLSSTDVLSEISFLIIIEIHYLHQLRQEYSLRDNQPEHRGWEVEQKTPTDESRRYTNQSSTDGLRTADWGNAAFYQPCEHSRHWWRDIGWINSRIRKLNGDIETGFPRDLEDIGIQWKDVDNVTMDWILWNVLLPIAPTRDLIW